MRTQTLILQTQPQPQQPNFEASVTIPVVLIVTASCGLVVAILGWFGKNYFDGRDARDAKAEERITKLEENHASLEKQFLQSRLFAQETYVTRDEHQLGIGRVDSRIEKLGNQIFQLTLTLESIKERLRGGT